jgi:DNA-binding HxlR family transcriptional regulator
MSKRKVTSTNYRNQAELRDFCGMNYALNLLAGRWKLLILYKLEYHAKRYSDLKKIMPNITDRMLTLHLRELERDGLVKRTLYPEVPARVEYELTDIARDLAPVWKQLEQWGTSHRSLKEG